MAFNDIMREKFPHLYNIPPQVVYNEPQPVPQPVPQQPPAMVQNIAAMINQMMPHLEQMTGLTRREIFLNLLKTGIKGGSINQMLDGLIGQKPQPEAKFVKYVKVAAIWIPAFFFLMGSALVGIYLLYRLALMLTGAI